MHCAQHKESSTSVKGITKLYESNLYQTTKILLRLMFKRNEHISETGSFVLGVLGPGKDV